MYLKGICMENFQEKFGVLFFSNFWFEKFKFCLFLAKFFSFDNENCFNENVI